MKKLLQSRSVLAVTFIAFFLCLVSAFAPLWVNQCAHRLTESEINSHLQRYEHMEPSALGSREELMAREKEWLNKRFVPCGIGDVSLEEKVWILNHYAGLFDDQLYLLPLPVLRMDLDYTHIDGYHNVYYFQAYTFFYVPTFCIRSAAPGRLLQFYDFTCPVIQESETP